MPVTNRTKYLILGISALALLLFYYKNFVDIADLKRESDLIHLSLGALACPIIAAFLNSIWWLQKIIMLVGIFIILWFLVVFVFLAGTYDHRALNGILLFVAGICNILVLISRKKEDESEFLEE